MNHILDFFKNMTAIEGLIVVAIIAILVSIAVPQSIADKQRAEAKREGKVEAVEVVKTVEPSRFKDHGHGLYTTNDFSSLADRLAIFLAEHPDLRITMIVNVNVNEQGILVITEPKTPSPVPAEKTVRQ